MKENTGQNKLSLLSLILALSLTGSLGTEAQASSKARSKSSTAKAKDAQDLKDGKLKIAANDNDSGKSAAGTEEKSEKSEKSDEKKEDTNKSDSKKEAKESKKSGKKDKAKAKDKEAKKDDKADKNSEKKDTSKAEEKKSGGFFHVGGKKKEDPKAKGKEDSKKETESQKAGAVKEDPNAPKYKFDPALISVLKDINKSLKDSEAVSKLEDPVQKLVARLAADALDKGLSAPDLSSNRIVDTKTSTDNSMSMEAWESGVLDVKPELKASIVAVWAKKVDGLLTLQIVGDYDGKAEGASERLGEFIVVVTARSSVDKGFDIQSQQDVNFWIGKVSDLKIDFNTGKGQDKNVKSLLYNLHAPVTERKRLFLAALKDYQDKLAKAEEDKKKQAEVEAALAVQQKQVAETLAKTVAEALAKSVGQKAAGNGAKGPTDLASAVKEAMQGGSVAEKKSEGAADLNSGKEPADSTAPVQIAETPEKIAAAQNPAATQASPNPNPAPEPALTKPSSKIFPEINRNSRSDWDSPSATTTIKQPSPQAQLFFPGRAVAGQYITVAVVGAHNLCEPYVGLSFNGAQLSTTENGKVVYQIPEDAQPGYSMRVGLSARPEESPGAIEVLQPLSSPSAPQIPNLESVSPVCAGGGMLTISGHNFDGIAERNRIIIDGAYDASVVVSSPVQIKARLPEGIPSGPHSLCVSTAGLRSNPGNFDLVTVDLSPAGPDTPKNDLRKLMVKVLGTQNRVRVKLVNQSRDVIKMLKGDELVVVTSGGAQNQIVVPVQRLRWGNYKIDAEILI